MTRLTERRRLLGFALTTALASGALAGCSTGQAPEARVSAGKADAALQKGRAAAAIRHAEAAVLAEPRVAEHRITLGAAYLQAGRFASAETSFAEAMELGGTAPRIVVSRALALVALGREDEGHDLLRRHADGIDPADLGLAFALAGDAQRGANILTGELRNGENTPKTRQNLAYAMALNGDWRTARLLVSEDVSPDRVGDRLTEWAATAAPEMRTLRVANLLGVTVAQDDSRPAELALANHPSTPMLAAEAAATRQGDAAPSIAVAMTDAAGELPAIVPVSAPPVAATSPAPAPAPTVRLVAAPAPEAKPVRLAAAPARAAPVRTAPARPAPVAIAPRPAMQLQSGGHLVQLGSYLSEAEARRAWGVLQSRFAALKDRPLVLTKAQVQGRLYYRVAAGNLAEGSARALCSAVKARGQGCFAYAGSRVLPGTIGQQVRVASR